MMYNKDEELSEKDCLAFIRNATSMRKSIHTTYTDDPVVAFQFIQHDSNIFLKERTLNLNYHIAPKEGQARWSTFHEKAHDEHSKKLVSGWVNLSDAITSWLLLL